MGIHFLLKFLQIGEVATYYYLIQPEFYLRNSSSASSGFRFLKAGIGLFHRFETKLV